MTSNDFYCFKMYWFITSLTLPFYMYAGNSHFTRFLTFYGWFSFPFYLRTMERITAAVEARVTSWKYALCSFLLNLHKGTMMQRNNEWLGQWGYLPKITFPFTDWRPAINSAFKAFIAPAKISSCRLVALAICRCLIFKAKTKCQFRYRTEWIYEKRIGTPIRFV